MILPAFLLKGLVSAMGFGYSIMGKEPPVSEEGVNFLLRQNQVSIEKARTKLGYNPKVPMPEGVRKTMDWVSQNYKSKV
jgi:nucleoside-diphosphate-sugar epimerase